MTFDRAYYDAIWPGQGVHRHDYCESLAASLAAQYAVRFASYKHRSILDIGTGCGYLVNLLRARGFVAYGAEKSIYALENCCAPGFVIYGEVIGLPFRDGMFELVHSQGMWEYVPEWEVPYGIIECKRVGRIQHHTIDTSECSILPEHQMVTVRPQAWWDEQFERANLSCVP